MASSLVKTDDDLRERVIAVVRALWGRDYRAAENETSIPSAKWKRLCNRVQQPTIEMLEQLGKARPYFIAWIATGRADTVFQLSPHENWQASLARSVLLD